MLGLKPLPFSYSACSLQNLLSHWIAGSYTCLRQLAKQIAKKATGEGLYRRLSDAEVRSFLSLRKPLFWFRGHTLFFEVTSFYQRGRGSALRGKWVISSQIGKGRWCISRMQRLVLPFKGRIKGRRWRIYRAWRLVLPFKWTSFKWTYFPNTGPWERLSTLNSQQGMEGRTLSLGESIR